jgi:Flp pilus assembly secretin CpaC/tetratricopeptide (TPR) repeat protein
VFQATKWGWKRLATNLLLIPVMSGVAATVAFAQSGPGPSPLAGAAGSSATQSRPAMTPTSGDPKALLKEGRKALEAKQFERAQDLARMAEANNAGKKWGLFEDTPAALLKDIQAGVLKVHKTQAEQLVKQARTLLARTAANDAERASNLDEALRLAERASQLHGPNYSSWEFSDRPDKLIKEIQAVRGRLNMPVAREKPAATPNAGGTVSSGTGAPAAARNTSGIQQASATVASRTTMDNKKQAAIQMMAEGRKLADQGMFAAARHKYAEAERVGATFGPNEYTPVFALRDLNKRGADAISKLIAEANSQMSRKDFARAEAALTGAAEVAAALNLYPRPIEDARAQLRTASSGKFGTVAMTASAGSTPAGTAQAPTTLNPVPPGHPTKPLPSMAAAKPPLKPLMPAGSSTVAAATNPLAPIPPVRGPVSPSTAGVVAATNPLPLIPAVSGPASPSNPGVAVVAPLPIPPIVNAGNTASGPNTQPAAPATSNPPGMAVVNALPVPSAGNAITGRELLAQAEIEFKAGSLDMAATLAVKAHNAGAVDEARALLTSIDTERHKLKCETARRSLEAADNAFKNKDFSRALDVVVLIESNLLEPEQRTRKEELRKACQEELNKNSKSGVAVAGGTQAPVLPVPPVTGDLQSQGAPPSAGVDPRGGADSVTAQTAALRRVQFQKLRSEGLKIQADANAAFGRGETDLAIQMLLDYAGRVRAAALEASSTALLLRPIESKLEMFRVMKGQADAIARQNKETRESRELVASRGGAAEEQRKSEVSSLVRKYHDLVKQNKFAEAEKVAMQAKQLDPDNPAINALAHMAKMNKRMQDAQKLKSDKEQFFLEGMNKAETEGPMVDVDDPVKVHIERMRIAQKRHSLDGVHVKTRSQAEYEIELKLDKPIQLEFSQTPLDQAIDNMRTLTKVPLVIDYASLEAEGISPVKPITVKPGQEVSTRHFLAFTLEQAGLSYVVENDMVKVTTNKKAKGRLFTKVFSVADLVTPIPNFALPDYANFDKMLNKNALNSGNVHIQGMTGTTPFTPPMGLTNGTPAGTLATTPGISGGVPFSPGGTIQSSTTGGTPPNPLAWSASLAGERNSKHEQLIKLITSMIRPFSWDGVGGPGRLEFYDIGSALVVNQTADVIQEVADLLEALRRLQDLALAVEIRIISLSETWYERMGVDFSMNILTNTNKFQPQLTQVDPNTGQSGVFAPIPYINSIRNVGVTTGLTPAGSFTPDLNVPITNNSFNMAIPPFGGYPNTPGADGGISLGLAFLNDIQVYLFMEAAAGDRRVNVMAAPKLTLFNGQTASISVSDIQFAVTNVTVVSVNGQLVFVPQNTPLPGPGQGALTVTIQGVVSADRRFVRLNLPVTLSAQTGASVPLFPITTFITPVFEGGSQGQPIPFTQFLQQPSFTTLTINTTVVCPDGGTVLLGGFKQLSEGRNEFGPPFLSNIPYLNRLFKNVGIGRETKHIMIMVTPRIIINSEEEIFQTEGRQAGPQP